jgi:hypothetical protein
MAVPTPISMFIIKLIICYKTPESLIYRSQESRVELSTFHYSQESRVELSTIERMKRIRFVQY